MYGEKHALLILAATSLGACTGSGWFGLPAISTEGSFAETVEHNASPHVDPAVADYLDLMHGMLEGDPVTQAEIFRATSAAAESWPTTTHLLKLALAVATPGHPWSDAAEAQRRLTVLLNSEYTLRPEERALARIQLRQVEEKLDLDEEARRQRSEAEEALERQNTDNARQLDAALQENRRLREELAEAQEKLEAITNIERSIRERESATDSP